jgi:hypothetical protein
MSRHVELGCSLCISIGDRRIDGDVGDDVGRGGRRQSSVFADAATAITVRELDALKVPMNASPTAAAAMVPSVWPPAVEGAM